jgi:hypothetical protein
VKNPSALPDECLYLLCALHRGKTWNATILEV